MSAKIINKAEDVRIAWLLTDSLTADCARGLFGEELTEWFNECRSHGKWREQRSRIATKYFDIYSTRMKHPDGRIRDAYTDVINLSEFAAWLLRHRGNDAIKGLIRDVLIRASDPRNVIRSVEGAHAKRFLKQSLPKDCNHDDVARLLTEAYVFQRLAA